MGKGASSRGPHGRIEEHGLHLLLGFYDETFEAMRRCYEELDRRSTDPASPILTWDDAVAPANSVGLVDREGGQWVPWVASFSATSGRPGGGRGRPVTVLDPARTRWRGKIHPGGDLLFNESSVGGSVGGDLLFNDGSVEQVDTDGLRSAMAKLFRHEPDTRELIKLKEIYEHLETVTDKCEDVANIIEGIVIENS